MPRLASLLVLYGLVRAKTRGGGVLLLAGSRLSRRGPVLVAPDSCYASS